jgi:hypothetical protein
LGAILDLETTTEVVYEDKSLYKAKGGVWHQKDRKVNHILEGLRALDKGMQVGQQACIMGGSTGMGII